MHRLAQVQHDVVGDIGGKVNRALAGQHEDALHPKWRLRFRVNASYLAQAKSNRLGFLAQVNVDETARSLRNLADRVDELQVESRSNLAAKATHGQRIAAVWGDINVEDGICTAQKWQRILTDVLSERLIQGDDALGLSGKTKLCCRANHAVGDVTIGLAGSDFEAARQLSAWQRYRNQRAFVEIARTADDPLQFAGAVGVSDVHLAVTNRLFELGEFFDLFYAADDHGTSDFWQWFIAFGFEADADEAGVEFFA